MYNENEQKRYGYVELMADLEGLSKYSAAKILILGESLMGRKIPLIRLGMGAHNVVYFGAHHGMESITSKLLVRFAYDFCEYLQANKRLYGLSLDYLYATRSIYIVPMLNPDGVELSVNGLDDGNPLAERLISMNGSRDFTKWQANGRGVDLNHNYDAGFEEYKQLEAEQGILGGCAGRYSGERPESEPETAAACNLLRSLGDVKLLLSLHTQGEEIYYTYGDKMPPRSEMLARQMSRLTGYRLSKPEGRAVYGGQKDWFIKEFGMPGFTVECGRGENPLPASDFGGIYTRIREMLFTLPAQC